MLNGQATLIFDETAGAGTYTALVGIPAGASVLDVTLVALSGAWDATTALLDMGDDLTGADAYFNGYDVGALVGPYDPSAPSQGTDFDTLVAAGNTYAPGGVFAADNPPGVLYAAADLITATLVTTGAGGTTGLLAVQIVGVGVPQVTHRAVKV